MEKVVAVDPRLEPLVRDGVIILPDWKRMKNPFDKIAETGLETDDKDDIVIYWKENGRILDKLAELRQVSASINLPKNESKEVGEVYESTLDLVRSANASLVDFIGTESKPNLVSKVIGLYASAIGVTRNDSKATMAKEFISEFRENEEDLDLTVAISKAIIEGRSANPDDNVLRQKVAQAVFQEMFEQMVIERVAAVHDIDMESSDIIDAPESEKIDLTSAFLGHTWTGDERKKMLRNYNKLRRVLNKLEADTDEKIGLNTLWRWANGRIPKDSSVFKILHQADILNSNITNTVADAWQAEADRLEDEEDSEY